MGPWGRGAPAAAGHRSMGRHAATARPQAAQEGASPPPPLTRPPLSRSRGATRARGAAWQSCPAQTGGRPPPPPPPPCAAGSARGSREEGWVRRCAGRAAARGKQCVCRRRMPSGGCANSGRRRREPGAAMPQPDSCPTRHPRTLSAPCLPVSACPCCAPAPPPNHTQPATASAHKRGRGPGPGEGAAAAALTVPRAERKEHSMPCLPSLQPRLRMRPRMRTTAARPSRCCPSLSASQCVWCR